MKSKCARIGANGPSVNIKDLIDELRQRNVIKSAIAYLAISWLVLQIASILVPAFDGPEYAMKVLIYVLIVGFVLWIGFSWLYDLTPEGFQKTENVRDHEAVRRSTGRRLDRVIIASLLFVIAILLVNQFVMRESSNSSPVDPTGEPQLRHYSNSIAVLAFRDLSRNKDQEYLSDGISESIISLLTKVPDLKVISSASSFQYKNQNTAIEEIAEQLDVNYILDGTVRKSGDLLRITAKLVDGIDGSQIWDRTFENSSSDVFQVQDEIANSVAGQLKLTFSDAGIHSRIADFEAYRLFLEASYMYHLFTPESMVRADALINNSIKRDSAYAPAWILLSKITDRRARNLDQVSDEQGRKTIIRSLNKALQLDPGNAEALAFLAKMEALQLNYDKARELVVQAIKNEPTNPEVLSIASDVHFYLGDIHESIRLEHEALAIDPLNPQRLFSLGLEYYFIHDFDNALDYMKQYGHLQPSSALHHMLTAVILTLQGKNEAALAEAEKEPFEAFRLFGTINAYTGLGDMQKSDSLLQVLMEKYPGESENLIAASYAWRGQNDLAFEYLEMEFEKNRSGLQESINWLYFSKLYDDPRWEDLLMRMELPEDHWILHSVR